MIVSVLVGAGFSLGAHAAPLGLPGGPLFVQFQNFEQIIPGATPGSENSWGVIQIRQISTGSVAVPNEQIIGGAPILFNAGDGGAQVLGMFHGLNALDPMTDTCPSAICSTGGYLDLYWYDSYPGFDWTTANFSAGDRTGADDFTGITDGGTFLVRLMFDSGVVPANSNITLTGSVNPAGGLGLTGEANGYFSVDTSVVGAWTEKLDGDWFNSAFGARDLRFKNSYFLPAATVENPAGLPNWGDPTNGVFGAISTDPVQAFAVPEPGVLGMLGLALLGLGFAKRRKT